MEAEIENIKKILLQDLNKYAANISKYMAQTIADELTEEAELAINDFYNQYNPKYYYRHGNFTKSFKRKYSNHNPVFSGGVELLEDSLPNVYTGRNSSSESIFWRVYLGYHGIASMQGFAPILSPSPIQRLYNKRDEIIKNSKKYENKAIKKAQSDSYTYLFN